MQITILTDNNISSENNLLSFEHGFSAYIEFDNKCILCDTGASNVFIRNAYFLGKDIGSLNYAVISHAHNDHTGGIGGLIENVHVPIYVSNMVWGCRFYSTRFGYRRDISMNFNLLNKYKGQFRFLNGSKWIDEGVAMVSCDTNKYLKPYFNHFLFKEDYFGERNDNFNHEMSLVFLTSKGLVIISPCSHNGALNIMDSCVRFTGEKRIVAFIGGLHFIDSSEVEKEVKSFLKQKNQLFPNVIIYTGHCTGDIAKNIMSSNPNIYFFKTGYKINI